MTPLAIAAAVVAGGGGALLRYAAALAFESSTARLPWAVLLVNVVGSSLGGAVVAIADAQLVDAAVRLVVLSGLAGGLTTFSTFSVETVQLVQSGRMRTAVANIAANVVLGTGGAVVGFAVAAAVV